MLISKTADVALASLAMLVLLSRVAVAGDAALAQELFERGRELMKEGDFAAACEKFEASFETEPSGGTALNLGRCYEKQNKLASAWAEYERAGSMLRAAGDTERAGFADGLAEALEPKLSRLTIEVAPTPGVTVTLDGREIEDAAFGIAAPVDPGEHRVSAEAPAHRTWQTTVVVGEEGDHAVVQVPPLEAQESDMDDEEGVSPLLVAGGVVAGVGGVTAIAGAILGGMVLSDVGEVDDDEALCGADKLCSPEGLATIEEAKDRALVSNVLLGVGSGLAAAGLVMVILGSLDEEPGEETSEERDESARFTPVVGAGLVGVAVDVTF